MIEPPLLAPGDDVLLLELQQASLADRLHMLELIDALELDPVDEDGPGEAELLRRLDLLLLLLFGGQGNDDALEAAHDGSLGHEVLTLASSGLFCGT